MDQVWRSRDLTKLILSWLPRVSQSIATRVCTRWRDLLGNSVSTLLFADLEDFVYGDPTHTDASTRVAGAEFHRVLYGAIGDGERHHRMFNCAMTRGLVPVVRYLMRWSSAYLTISIDQIIRANQPKFLRCCEFYDRSWQFWEIFRRGSCELLQAFLDADYYHVFDSIDKNFYIIGSLDSEEIIKRKIDIVANKFSISEPFWIELQTYAINVHVKLLKGLEPHIIKVTELLGTIDKQLCEKLGNCEVHDRIRHICGCKKRQRRTKKQ